MSSAELAKTFIVNITSVVLVNILPSSNTSLPRVRRPGNIASITISEHGNPSGILQFSVHTVSAYFDKNLYLDYNYKMFIIK